MKVRKLGAILLAGTLAATSAVAAVNTIPVVSAATAEENTVDWATLKLSETDELHGFKSLGDGFGLFNTKDGGTAIVHLTAENGKLTYTNVKTDVDLSKHWSCWYNNGEYFSLSDDNKVGYVMRLDKSKNEANIVYEYSGSLTGFTDDNYAVIYSDNKYSLVKPDGTSVTEIQNSENNYLTVDKHGGKYAAYYLETATDKSSYKIYGLDRDGKLTEVISSPENWSNQRIGSLEDTVIAQVGLSGCNRNYILVSTLFEETDGTPYAQPHYDFIDLSTGKVTILTNTTNAFSYIDKNGLISYEGDGSLYDPQQQQYLENGYCALTLDDGETYSICGDSWSECGFADDNNNLISKVWYDSAGAFCGDYAPVVKDGEGYLIDKKGNCVSEKIPAKTATTLGENLYRFGDGTWNKDDWTYTMVYVDNGSSSSKPDDTSSSTTTPESSSSSSSSSSTTTPESSSSSSSSSSTTTPQGSSSSSSSSSTTTPASSSTTPAGSSSTPTSSSSTTTESKNFSDATTKVEVSVPKSLFEGTLKDATLAVEQVKNTNANDKTVTYDISFKDKDGKAVSLDKNTTEITVKLPIPEALKDEKKLYVYYVDNGKYTDMKATVKDGSLEFKTTHFSKYLITTDGTLESTDKENADTGFGGIAVTVGIVALAGAAIVATRKKR